MTPRRPDDTSDPNHPLIARARELAIADGNEWCTRRYLAEGEDERADDRFQEYIDQARKETE